MPVEPVDIVPVSDDLTLSQLERCRESADGELSDLVENGDKTIAVSRRVRELRTFISELDAGIAEVSGTEFAAVEKPVAAEPEPEPDVKEEPAPASEPDPVVDPEPETPAEPETDPVADAARIVSEALDDPDLVAKIAEGIGVQHDETVTADEILDKAETVNDQPIFASVGKGSDVVATGPTTLEAVGARIKQMIAGWSQLGPMDQLNLYQANRGHSLNVDDSLRLGPDPKANNEILFGSKRGDSIAAAAGLGICGDATRIQVAGCPIDNSTPFMDALSGNSISARACRVEWDIPLSFEDINPGPTLWSSNCEGSDQAGVDPSDQSTWKPVSVELPDCSDKCYAEPFDSVAGLKISMNDEICRPEKIAEANRAIDCLHSILLEKTAMNIFDSNVGPSHHFAFDAAATTLGAYPSLVYALASLTSTFGLDRKSSVTGNGLVAAVHPSILRTVQFDMFLAGEQGGSAEAAISDAFRMAGISRVVYTKDFGECEGELCGSLPGNEIKCDITNCGVGDLAAGCVPFGGGNPLPALAADARVRIFNPENWWHGWEWLVDYALRKDASDLRQNCGFFFGERRDLLFKASNCGAFEAVLDLTGMCATGQRVEHKGAFPCPPPGAAKVVSAAAGKAVTAEKTKVSASSRK